MDTLAWRDSSGALLKTTNFNMQIKSPRITCDVMNFLNEMSYLNMKKTILRMQPATHFVNIANYFTLNSPAFYFSKWCFSIS